MHILKPKEIRVRHLSRHHSGVVVKVDKQNLIISGGVLVVKEGTEITELPSRIDVMAVKDGVPISASGKFWITVETIDPQHVLLDISDESAIQ